MKPDFLFVGPTKSGTTWIDAYLRERGDVSLPVDTKETFFFDKAYGRGAEWYFSLFDPDPSNKVCVEVAPSLFHKPVAAERAARILAGARIICTIRDPIDRAVSHYFHYRKEGEPRRPISEMARAKPDLILPGRYFTNIRHWQDAFGADHVHCLYYDDLRSRPDDFCRQLCALLGLPYVAPSDAMQGNFVNEAGVPRSRLVAMVARRAASALRTAGFHKAVNLLKREKIRSAIFSGGAGFKEEREEVRASAAALLPFFEEDLRQFEKAVGRRIRRTGLPEAAVRWQAPEQGNSAPSEAKRPAGSKPYN